MTAVSVDGRVGRSSTWRRPPRAPRARDRRSPAAQPRTVAVRSARAVQPPPPALASSPGLLLARPVGVGRVAGVARPTERALGWMVVAIAFITVAAVVAIIGSFLSISNAPLGQQGARPAGSASAHPAG